MNKDQIESLIPLLKEKNLRVTPQRIQILTTLIDMNGHPTAEDIQKRIPIISLATIYNNLKLFVELGIINELPYGNGLSRFEFSQSNHYHVICESCGKIADINYPELTEIEEMVANLTGFSVNKHNMEVYGKCQECIEKG
ncbi:Fur family transcriptional regulator [Cytobacillus sp. FSL R5-0569]|uniref:Fur family transcriptional regulator n=1 Tax=Cytobacillus TaxID=2675230 RepID=UPI00278338B3|nr:Fur family transcriptional regulator [Cytobacillus kochii]MDQ0184565.1 Fur family peroxide stress response transcriptional regulator [Cytobacillus kochii]